MEIGLSLGTNLGDRLHNLRRAESLINAIDDVTIVGRSRIYETDPVDVPDEFADKPFLNSILIVDTSLPLADIATHMAGIEDNMGRKRSSQANAPRVIDVDIIYAGNIQQEAGSLIVPHPRWSTRRFVVQPLADLKPNLVLPSETKTVAEVLLSLPAIPKVIPYR